jgi:Uncharacterized protein conserved in bacteria
MALGDLLTFFDAPGASSGNGRAVAFDGQFLYITKVGDTNIYKVTTAGTLVSTIPSTHVYGCLKFDSSEGVFWAGNYEGNFELYKVDLSGNVLATVNYSGILNSPEGSDPGFADGITVDPISNTLFFGTDLGLWVYQIQKFNVSGNAVKLSSFSTTNKSGVESDGINLWIAHANAQSIEEVNTAGGSLGNSFTTQISGTYFPECLEFDSVTFEPKCALWSNEATFGVNRVAAWEIPCPFNIVRGIELF